MYYKTDLDPISRPGYARVRHMQMMVPVMVPVMILTESTGNDTLMVFVIIFRNLLFLVQFSNAQVLFCWTLT